MRRVVLLLSLSLLVPATARATSFDPPMKLPGRGSAGAQQWLLGIARGTPVPAGATVVRPGTLLVPRERAQAVAAELRALDALLYAEPDGAFTQEASPDADLGGWARGAVVRPDLPWPTNPVPIAVIDDFVDPSHPDVGPITGFLNANQSSTLGGPHGTMVASAAAGLFQGNGVAGVMPGAPIASYGVKFPASCSDVSKGIDSARSAGVAIINLSLGSPDFCYTQYLATQKAYGVGVLVVAAAGNEFQNGNPVNFPAALPHVMSVAAIDRKGAPAEFSTANAGVDIAAPGVGVPLAIPVSFDTDDGTQDGYTLADGTSFSAPMVAGGASWVRAARPDLTVGQVADVLRFSALDLAAQGYDRDTGWGLMSVEGALNLPAPRDDPIEPNDGIDFVDGRVFAKPDRVRWSGSGRSSLTASTDQWEDPLDVYRFRLSPRSRARITVQTTGGEVLLGVYDKVAKSVSKARGRVCRSRRPKRHQTCTVVYNGSRPRFGYVAVAAAGDVSLNANYVLRFRRL